MIKCNDLGTQRWIFDLTRHNRFGLDFGIGNYVSTPPGWALAVIGGVSLSYSVDNRNRF